MSDVNDVRRIIERHNADLAGWYASGDIEQVAARFAEDCWQMNPGMPPLVGRAALRSFWQEAQQLGKWEFDLQLQDLTMSGPLAVERGLGTLTFTAGPGAPESMDSYVEKANYVAVWQLEEDGEWRILWDAPVSLGTE